MFQRFNVTRSQRFGSGGAQAKFGVDARVPRTLSRGAAQLRIGTKKESAALAKL